MGDGAPSQTPGRSPAPQPQAGPEQSGILDWLRKLRLHKYYPVFKQLTMEKVGLSVGQGRGIEWEESAVGEGL